MRVVRSPSANVTVPVPAESNVGGITVVGVDPEVDITQGDTCGKSRYRQSHQRVNRVGD